MPEEKDKVFDFSNPGTVSPHASGRPVIVGHHPTMVDPMLRPMHKSPQPLDVQPPSAGLPSSPPAGAAQPMFPSPGEPTPTVPTQPIQPTAPTPVPPAPSPGFEPIGNLPPTPQPAAATPPPQAGAPLPTAVVGEHHMAHHELPISKDESRKSGWRKLVLWLLLLLAAIGIGFYLALDSGLISNNIKLPLDLIKDKKVAVVKVTTTPPPAPPAVPAGFSAYTDSALPFSFNYPTIWGVPTVTTEQGFSKRGGTNKTDGTYAYFVNFATNKDVQIAVTSGKYLPPTRSTQYYDFLAWCVSTTDTKIYKSVLNFTTATGVDIPSTTTCNQGPLADAAKIDTTTIVQTDTKATDGTALGDVYTKNLGTADLPVVRVKDATRKNGADIKIILNTNLASTTTP
jgi:hypothetical protein